MANLTISFKGVGTRFENFCPVLRQANFKIFCPVLGRLSFLNLQKIIREANPDIFLENMLLIASF
jgi:hypothetical protein